MWLKSLLALLCLVAFSACTNQKTIVNDVDERDANEIIVYLAGKNIDASKEQSASAGGGAANKEILWNIVVPANEAISALTYLNDAGLPKRKSPNLLTIFGPSTLVPSDLQEKVRYQAGLAQQIANTIKEIDGVLDANVIISFPEQDPLNPGKYLKPITASVYVKHNGVLDDPNLFLVSKIKRLVAASVSGLTPDNVTVIGEKADISKNPTDFRNINPRNDLEKVWTIVIAKASIPRFHLIFLTLLLGNLILGSALIWLLRKLSPALRETGWSYLFNRKAFQVKAEKKLEKTAVEEQVKPTKKEEPQDKKDIEDI